jgi:hypothetical protein
LTRWLSELLLSSREVQMLHRHARLATTERYVHASVPDLIELEAGAVN